MPPPVTTDHDLVLVVDFGAQYAQLIARRVREARVYSEIVPHTTPVEEILAREPKAIILSGGPSSVYEPGAPNVDTAVFEAGVPVFGMCYGFQAMALNLGGEVRRTGRSEYGRTPVTVSRPGTLLAEVPAEHKVWMSHGDSVVAAPPGWDVLASTAATPMSTPRSIPRIAGQPLSRLRSTYCMMPPLRKYAASPGVSMRTTASNSTGSPSPACAVTLTVRGVSPSFIAVTPVIVNVSSPVSPSDSAF